MSSMTGKTSLLIRYGRAELAPRTFRGTAGLVIRLLNWWRYRLEVAVARRVRRYFGAQDPAPLPTAVTAPVEVTPAEPRPRSLHESLFDNVESLPKIYMEFGDRPTPVMPPSMPEIDVNSHAASATLTPRQDVRGKPMDDLFAKYGGQDAAQVRPVRVRTLRIRDPRGLGSQAEEVEVIVPDSEGADDKRTP